MSKPLHWTYEEYDNDDDLKQGDILQSTETIQSLLEEFHPHFRDEKYKAFLVLTQSCDLLRRNGNPPATNYINIAVIRPLRDVMSTLLSHVCDPVKIDKSVVAGTFIGETRYKGEQLIQRIINQNEQKLGLFYLYPDADVGIAEHSVALLKVNITFKTSHYSNLINARYGRLKPQFRSKLGWLTGNLFARVATQDWGGKKKRELVDEIMNLESTSSTPLEWIPHKKFKKAKEQIRTTNTMTREELVEKINAVEIESSLEKACKMISSVIEDVRPDMTDEEVTRILNRLKNNPDFNSILKK